MNDLLESILKNIDKKKVQGCCKRLLKKYSPTSLHDRVEIVDLTYWLYIYGYNDEAIKVCELFEDYEFTGNYTLWNCVDECLCLKARILREEGKGKDERDKLLAKVNEHRVPELYPNLVKWYRETININIQNEDEFHSKKINPDWRMVKLKHAIPEREAGGRPIPDEEYERDIKELIDVLKQVN